MSSSTQKLSTKFPQRVDVASAEGGLPMARLYTGPDALRSLDGARHFRFESIQSYSTDVSGARFEVQGSWYENRFVQTHETQMYQFAGGPDSEIMGVEVSFFGHNVVRVRAGKSPPADPLAGLEQGDRMLAASSDPSVRVSVAEREQVSAGASLLDGPGTETISLSESGSDIVVRVARDPFSLRLVDRDGHEIVAQKKRDLFTSDVWDTGLVTAARADSRTPTTAFAEALELREGERIVGLGERFDGVIRNGRPVDFRNKDAIGTSSPRTYINVPFYMSSRGYGLFLNSTANPEWNIGVDDHTALQILVEDESIDCFLIYGPDPASILARYAGLTGYAPVPPVWSFGLWLSRNSYTSWDVVDRVVEEADAHGLPFDVIHLDTAWFSEDWNCDLCFSPDRFPDAPAHMARLREQGLRVSLWQYNFIPPRANNQNFIDAVEGDYLVRGPDGGEFSYPDGTIGSWIDDQIIDFTNPEAAAWYGTQIEKLISDGAAAIKVDFGEGVPDHAQCENVAGNRIHNLCSLIYTRAIAEATHRASGEWIVWARSGTAGSQRYPVHWGGDSQCSWAGLRGTLKAALSIGLSGIPCFSHDIGGFIGRPSAELYIRWAQFGLLSSHSRTHGNGDDNSREPWSFGDEADRIFRRFAELRYTLLPYLVHCAYEAREDALPVVRSMLLEFPDDEIAWTLEDQYMLGSSLLIAPVLAPLEREPIRRIYLPRGTWYDYWTKERTESSGEWREQQATLDRIPIYVRGGSLVPYTNVRLRTGNTVLPIVRLEAYESADTDEAARVVVREADTELVWEFRRGQVRAIQEKDQPQVHIYRGQGV